MALKTGVKKFDTRAGGPKYAKVTAGDTIIFTCRGERFERKVHEVQHFKNPDELFKVYDYREIMPLAHSQEEAAASFYQFPGYKERISRYGILAFI